MARIIIIRPDGFVSIGGRGFGGLDMSGVDPQIHAVQWFDTIGEIELVPDENGQPANIAITNLDFCQSAIDAWVTAAEAEDTPPQPLTPADYAIQKKAELQNACREHITGGVISSALGSDHTYPTKETDQLNLNGCITESLLNDADVNWSTPFWCADANGLWDRRLHTHAQIRTAGTAVAGHVREAQNKLKSLNDQLQVIVADAGLTDDEKRTAIDAVVW